MALTWAGKRQLTVMGIIFGAILIVASFYIIPAVTKAPTCSDGVQNGTETGVDCGGKCPTFCAFEVTKPIVLWSQAFPVSDTVYNLAAYVENQNTNAAVNSISYNFKIYDSNYVFIAEHAGSAFIPPKGNFVIFDAGVYVGNRIPVHTKFEFTSSPNWLKVSQATMDKIPVLTVSDQDLTNVGTIPTLVAKVSNHSVYTVNDVAVVAILSGDDGNAIGVSQTTIDTLNANDSKQIFFTWPKALNGVVKKIDIIPKFDYSSIKF